MYLKCHRRVKDGKEHRYWSIAEKRRLSGRRVVDRHVLYLGEINDNQRAAWLKSIEAFDETRGQQRRLALFPADRAIPEHASDYGVQVRLKDFELRRPRQWGACWAFCRLWEQLGLEEFWRPRLADSREGTNWYHVLMLLGAYRLIDPGSEWRLHRQWFEQSAMGDLLGEDASLAAKDTLYRCLDKLLPHKQAMQQFLRRRWQDLFGASFDVLLYDLTSTYFESDPPFDDEDKRRYGYSRDHRPDCVQVVIALIVTPEGFPLTYEVLAGNTADSTTLPQFLERIERLYGKAQRIWVTDRGIPTAAHPWAPFRSTKAAVKLHTLLDLRGSIPAFIHISDGKLHEVNVLDLLIIEAGAFYIMDRGYLDFERLYALDQAGGFFVTRGKRNLDARRLYSAPVDRNSGLICDQTIVLNGFYAAKHYPGHLRRIRYRDPETGKRLVFLTNQFALPPLTICALYKCRWQVELFFKWIKQHLRIKRFYGTSENAVRTQIWIAISVYVLVAIIKKQLKLDASLHTLLQILSVTLFEKLPLQQAVADIVPTTNDIVLHNQLKLFEF